MAANAVKPHHVKAEFCTTRAPYREGRELKAVKVYTINQESRYLLVHGVPSVGAHDDLLKMFALYGAIEEYRHLDEYPAEEFTEVMWIKFQKLPAARIAKRKMDNQSFYGGVLHVCFAPEYESVQDTREKMQERRKTIAARIRRLEAEEGQTAGPKPSTSTMASSEEWSYRPQQTKQQQQESSQRVPPPHDYSSHHRQHHQHQHHQHQQHHQNQRHHQQQHQYHQQQHHQQNQQPEQQQSQPQHQQRHQNQHQQQQHQQKQHSYPALPLPPQYTNTTTGSYPSAALGGPQLNPNTQTQHTPVTSQTQTEPTSQGPHSSSIDKGQGIIIKEFHNRTVPKFVPRQVRDPSRKPLIKKHLLVKKKPPEVEKDAVNEELKMESFVLRDVQGPQLPEAEEERRSTFKTTETGSESVDQTVAAIRKRVHEFSVIAPPPQLKRKKKT